MQAHAPNPYPYHQQHNLPPMNMPPHHGHGIGQDDGMAQQAMHQPLTPSHSSDRLSQQQPSSATEETVPLRIYSGIDHKKGWKFTLQVVQQPQRARMCGFGDKDRRPITPPPCVRLIVTDVKTGKEVDCNEIDHAHYVISVDLWNEDGTREVNLVRHTTATPSISSTTPASYTAVDAQTSTPAYSHPSAMSPHSPSPYPPFAPAMPQGMAPGYPMSHSYHSPQGYMPHQGLPQNSYGPPQQFYPEQFQQQAMVPSQGGMGGYGPRGSFGNDGGMPRFSMGNGQPQGMFTRNLIGSLVTSACRLTDPTDKIGIWFILQDLSVRTEGSFRLRFSFVDVTPMETNQQGQSPPDKAPVLAACFSDVFTVFSAKKFPGVCESTPLSKCFAGQGVKIPIRKEGSGKGGDDDDY